MAKNAAAPLDNPKKLRQLVERYFEGAKGKQALGENGEPLYGRGGLPVMEDGYPLTMAGLACAVGMSRKELLEFSGEGEAAKILFQARGRVEAYAEAALFESGSASGAKFALSNNCAGWEEKKGEKSRAPAQWDDEELEKRIRQLEGAKEENVR